jgi:hypothetical protein
MFKKWFSKQDKNSSPDSDPDYEMHTMKAYIVLGVDQDGDNFVAVQFAEEEHQRMAELLFLLVSGQMIEETVKSLRRACKTDDEAKYVINMLAQMMAAHAQQEMGKKHRPSSAVIDPTEVFNRGEKNEFKG